MIIILSPQVREDRLEVFKYKDTIVINRVEFDFSKLPEGAVLPSYAVENEYLTGDITRKDGELIFNMIFPIPWDAEESLRFPVDIVNPADGKVLDTGEVNAD